MQKKLLFNLAVIALAMGAMIAFGALTGTEQVLARGSTCEGDQKIEGDGPTYFEAPSGQSVGWVCIKAGQGVFTYECGEVDESGCYSLDWTFGSDGCCTAVTVGGGGTGRDCKSISHTAATWADGPCVTPSPSPDPSPSPEPSPDPSPDPSPGA